MVLSLILLLPLIIGNDGCTTPTKETGDCRNLKNCSVLVDLLRQNQTSATSLVKESICGFEGIDSLVCCPLSNNTAVRVQETPTEISAEQTKEDQCGQANFQTDKIVGGDDANLGEWPWLAALGYTTPRQATVKWACGGALVTKRHILTAAHCVNAPSFNLTIARLGDLNLDDDVGDQATPLDVPVDQALPHPDYSSQNKANDIAIVKLKTDVPFSENIRPICLPKSSYFDSNSLTDKIVKVAGWGRVEFGGPASKKLKQVELKIIDDDTCKNTYKSFGVVIDSRVMCAGTPGKSACQGDSGGPLVLVQNFTHYVVGLVSFGKGCGTPGYPGVATRVLSFLPWITTNLN